MRKLFAAVAVAVAAMLAVGLTGCASDASAPKSIVALDTAEHDGPYPRAWFDTAYKNGARLFILQDVDWGTCTPWPTAKSQFQLALNAGFKIAAYTRDPSCWSGGVKAASGLKLQFFVIDIETTGTSGQATHYTTAQVQSYVNGVTAAGVRPVIYTGADMWSGLMGGNVTAFSKVPLWDADAGVVKAPKQTALASWANVSTPALRAFGGWNTASNPRVAVQQVLDYTLDGKVVDLSSFNASF